MLLHKTFGVDLGTSTVKIYSQDNDTIITEKNMIAIRNQNQILAVGNEAYKIFEKNPSNVSVISPMAYGKIADVNHTEMVLQALLEKINAGGLFNNNLYLAVPSDLAEIEQRAYYTIGNSNRKNKIYMVNKTIADAVALGIPINNTKGSMIVNIGAQSTEISVIERGKIVLSKIIAMGGAQLNEAIVNEVRKNYNLHIGNRTARRLKFSLAYLKEDIKEARKIVGIDSLSGLPREGIIPSDMQASTHSPHPIHRRASLCGRKLTGFSASTDFFLQALIQAPQLTQRSGSNCGTVMPIIPKSCIRTLAQSLGQPVRAILK